MASQSQVQAIKRAFALADANKDGLLSVEELKAIFKLLPGSDTWTDQDFDFLFKVVDVNNDGKLSYDEFVDWVMESSLNPEDLQFDPSGSYVVRQEVSEIGMLSHTVHLLRDGRVHCNWVQVTEESSGGVSQKGRWKTSGSSVKLTLEKGKYFQDKSVLPESLAVLAVDDSYSSQGYPKVCTYAFDELRAMPTSGDPLDELSD
eukprot:gnl/MRDRNA2_/MRDRNA2_94024_c0_seq1.p1 gnl/MRDRNA2_/MRDRNA2_94024_c0~~gnl/MRDRNA2_/MRDRNA2_94024_c0_seq1.p1  ORF type:complete len:203 (-),score=47.89 gnl/MRDRNA2_/MRDRNA2_94024_c0_seq1:310-918(-)